MRNACLAQGKGEHEDAEAPRHAQKLPVIMAGWLVRASVRGYARARTHRYALDLFAESVVENFHAFILAHGAATILITNHKLYKVEQPCWFAALLPVSTRTLVSD